ncbi:MAG: helix-turn-helix domain-containing protein [Planctomycetes bacterium]|nr:helix-turn-helix domain-containing protein [Planctomycetota bacterium]
MSQHATAGSSSVNQNGESLLTEDEAVQFLRLDDRKNPMGALRWLCRTRRLAYIQVGRGIRRFRAGDLEAYIEQQRVQAVT